MPWPEVSLMALRREFVVLAQQPGVNFRALCRRFTISRKTGYKWCRRAQQEGDAALQDRSRRPHTSPRQTPAPLEAAILALRAEFPAWGGRKLAHVAQVRAITPTPAPSTITAILRRHDQLDATRIGPCVWQRFEHPYPNALWQMDFKGHFATETCRCHPLTVLDDHSRYALVLQACPNERTDTVQAHLLTAFRRYGLPEALLMDNGAPWGDGPGSPYTPLGVWLIRLGVRLCHSRPYHPQTLGKDERFHQTLLAEVLRYRRFPDLAACQAAFETWREVYNTVRPHESLGDVPPIRRYAVSPRPYPEALPPIEYGPVDQVRKVQQGGIIHFHGREIRLCRAFAGEPVALRPTGVDGHFAVYYCHQNIAHVTLTVRPPERYDV